MAWLLRRPAGEREPVDLGVVPDVDRQGRVKKDPVDRHGMGMAQGQGAQFPGQLGLRLRRQGSRRLHHQGRFLAQARVLSEVDSPHVMRVLDFGVDGETPYLVGEFVDGVTLTELVDGSGPGVSLRADVEIEEVQGEKPLVTFIGTGLNLEHRRAMTGLQ